MSDSSRRLLAGRIGKPHALAGEVYVERISDDPRRFEAGARLVHEDGRTLVVARSRPHGNRLLVKFEGTDGRTEAEGLRGPVYVTLDDLRALGDDEYWAHELVGCTVVEPDGNVIGRVADVVAGAAQDLLALDTPAGERLVPIVEQIVKRVDTASRRIVVEPPPGLLS